MFLSTAHGGHNQRGSRHHDKHSVKDVGLERILKVSGIHIACCKLYFELLMPSPIQALRASHLILWRVCSYSRGLSLLPYASMHVFNTE